MSQPSSPVACGAPGAAFSVTAFDASVLVGQKLRLPAWSNRLDPDFLDGHQVRLDWTVALAPAGSAAGGEHLSGAVSPATTPGCEQVALDGQVPAFTPDVAGRYVLALTATELDTGATAHALATVDASAGAHPGEAAGCSAAGDGLAPLAVLVACVVALRRRGATGPRAA